MAAYILSGFPLDCPRNGVILIYPSAQASPKYRDTHQIDLTGTIAAETKDYIERNVF